VHFVPHTDAEVGEMLASMGLSSLDDLFSVIPPALRLAGGLDLEAGLSEPDVAVRFDAYAAANRPAGPGLVCFAGGGA
jgi:glycine dehydrogenase subunit 1